MEKIKVDGVYINGIINNSKSNTKILIENYDIEINVSIAFDISEKKLEFKNCNFTGEKIEFFQAVFHKIELPEVYETISAKKKHQTFLHFNDCSFKNSLHILRCKLDGLRFYNLNIDSSNFVIGSSTIDSISFNGTSDGCNTINKLSIIGVKDNFDTSTFFNFNNHKINSLSLSYTHISQSWIVENDIGSFSITDSTIGDIFLLNNTVKNKSNIKKCVINRMYTNYSVFEKDIEFEDSLFKDEVLFEKTTNLNSSSVNFLNINFEKKVSFEGSNLFYLKFNFIFFKDIVSFQTMKCECLDFSKTHFDKVGYFNDLEIKSYEKCTLNTLRTIKNQLNKTENKIDYLKFSVYEFNNLKSEKATTKADYVLLWLNEYSNNFGTSWVRGVCFTLIFSIFFFLILLIANSYLDSSYPLCLNLNNEPEKFSFILNYFLKFVFNLGLNDTEIQSNGWLYLVFILTKIFISYGIYQTIQAFRKYGK